MLQISADSSDTITITQSINKKSQRLGIRESNIKKKDKTKVSVSLK